MPRCRSTPLKTRKLLSRECSRLPRHLQAKPIPQQGCLSCTDFSFLFFHFYFTM